ncbi:hypothetical protein PBAL39_23092 [Pedobacter sp. BAL39]|uniref:DUF4397 domain-containing protein n=1 Tax=Pedobacter sp. BAL39 TaxID=391596 RepID=UPI0001559E32|nr:DUF4397 domain-containing protein [Pedobacter sp. BAL39]EDM35944.1 hypothetical protein PBAL39_23092 [Pedobacter sp. BAL39]
MKRRTAFMVITIVTLAGTFFSCKKNTLDPSGQFNIKVVNASATAGAQSFTLAGNVLLNGGLNYMDASAYINAPSGKNMITEFRNASTNAVYASGSIYTANGVNFTVYLAGSGSNARVKNFEDDLATPNNGQVKIKFVHLSNRAPNIIKIKDANGDDYANSLVRDQATGYKYVSPGTIGIEVAGLTSGNSVGSYRFTDLVAGKIYSFYLTDDASGNVVMNKIIHN